MAQTLRDFIKAREGEIKAQIIALNDELRELRAAKSAVDGTSPAQSTRVASSRMTHRDMIVEVLAERPEGGTFDKVMEWIREKFDTEIPQASMSSQLSRAKSDGLLDLDMTSKIWRSAKHSPKKNEPPEGGSQITEDVRPSSYQAGQQTMPGLSSAAHGTAPTPFGSREGGQQDV